MNKAALKYKNESVSKGKVHKKRRSVSTMTGDSLINSLVSRRIDELALPGTRTLIENHEQFKRILTDRAADSIEQKLKKPRHWRNGEDEDINLPKTTNLCFGEPKYKQNVSVDDIAKTKLLSYNKLKASASGPTRTDILSKPLIRRLPVPVVKQSPLSNVKPSTLRYIPNERILELAKPKKIQPKSKVIKKRRKKVAQVKARSGWKR